MPRRTRAWIWAGRAAAAAALIGMAGYMYAAGLDQAGRLAAPIGIVLALAALFAPYLLPAYQRPARPAGGVPGSRLSQAPTVAGWVDRGELAEVVSALTDAGSGAVALTTGLVGAGGFGKTTLAARACQDRAVLRRFGGGVVWVTVGRDTAGPGLAARISEVIANAGGGGPAFASLEQAGQALAGTLSGRGRTLLVVDDVWTAAQLEPFLAAGQAGRLLVTTRRPAVLADTAAGRITVDAMPDPVARLLLTRGLPPMAARMERELLGLTGRWPLLLNLVNHRLAGDVEHGAAIDAAAAAAAGRLSDDGRAALDVTDSGKRETAVAATVDYSLDALDAADRTRFYELGIFAEDAEVPVPVTALLWQGTAGLSAAESETLCDRLDGLSLLALAWADQVRVLVIHDVIRDFARSRLGSGGQRAAHAALIRAARPVAGQDGAVEPARRGGDGTAAGTSWWRLPEAADSGYLWQYLTYHLQKAGLDAELDQVCGDLRFLAVRLRHSGPAAVEADLARSGSPAAARVRRVVAQNAHLLGPIEPAGALITTLTSRLGGIPELAGQLPALRSGLGAWTAWPSWPPPDQSDALIRVLSGHTYSVKAVAISPDGSWLATASIDGTVRTWAADGSPRATLTGHGGWVAISPDGTWLATGGIDGTVRTWAADGTPRATLTGHHGSVGAVAISPDGTWVAVASQSWDGKVRTWAADGTPRATLTGHHGSVGAVAISPDGTWLATCGVDGTVRTWAADGTPRAILTGNDDPVGAVAISPDGTWLAACGDDGDGGTVRIWAADGTPRATLTGHDNRVIAVAISPDGTWLATASYDGTARTWAADGSLRATLTGHYRWVNAVAIAPDGTWLATCGVDGTVRTWAADGTPRATLTGHGGRDDPVNAVAISPDGTWLAACGDDGDGGTARIWAAGGPDPGHPARPRRPGVRGGDRPGRHLARHRRLRQDSPDLGRRLRPRWDGPDLGRRRPPPRHPHRPRRRCAHGGDRPGRDLARHRQRRRDCPDLGRRRHPPRHPHPRRLGVRGGDRPGRHLARHRRQRRDGPDLGRRRHSPLHPHRPQRQRARGGDLPGWHLDRHQRPRADGPDLGRRRP